MSFQTPVQALNSTTLTAQSIVPRQGAQSLKVANMKLKRLPKAPLNPVVVFAEQFWKEHKT